MLNSSLLPGSCRHGNVGLCGRTPESTWLSFPSLFCVCCACTLLSFPLFTTSTHTHTHTHTHTRTHVQLLAVIFSTGTPCFASLIHWTRFQMSPTYQDSWAKTRQGVGKALPLLIMLYWFVLQNDLLVTLKWEMKNDDKGAYISGWRVPAMWTYLQDIF
jgi:hypothetical protein